MIGGKRPSSSRLIQVGALCWRRRGVLEVLLVTTLRTRRWIIPKGWPQMGRTFMQAAASEAFEEAGVIGEPSRRPIGQFCYDKIKRGTALPCRVLVFAMHVTLDKDSWPEAHKREKAWLSVQEAARRVVEPELRQLILGVPLLEKQRRGAPKAR